LPRMNDEERILPVGGGECLPQIAMVKRMLEPKRLKPGRPKGPGPVRETVVSLKGSPEWKAWLDGFSAHCRLGLADTIEQSLVYYAVERGFLGPPKR
jgi:hypothetical protein